MCAQVIEITDLADPRVDVYRNVRDADMRGRDGLFMAESELVLRRLVRTPERLHSMLLSPEKFRRLSADLQTVPDSVPVYIADLKMMHEIAAFHIHRGVLAAGHRLPSEFLNIDAALGHLRGQASFTLMACQGITNVDNMGAIFRNSAAFGVNGVVLDPACCDPLYRKAIRVSMGHVLSIPYAISENWAADLGRLKQEWGVTLTAAESGAHAIPPTLMPRSDRTMIVVGSEGHGLSEATLNLCDAVCEIPMAGDVPSINVAVATAVMLYELQQSRQSGI